MSPETWQAVFDVNTTGTMLMIKYALPMLIEAGDCAIINIGSGHVADVSESFWSGIDK
jgi:NAD(P)-dependent dehydrogenase (short-subunit alcohol dehydrogenase family)